MVLHYSRGDMDCGVVADRMKHLKPETPSQLMRFQRLTSVVSSREE